MIFYILTYTYSIISLLILSRLVMVILGFKKLPELLEIRKMRDVFFTSVLPFTFIERDGGIIVKFWNWMNRIMIILYLIFLILGGIEWLF